MKSYSIFLLIIISAFGSYSQTESYQIMVESASLNLKGSTNVNQFTCEFEVDHPLDRLQVERTFDSKEIFFSGLQLTFPVKKFDCGIEAMNKDFYGILNADQNPNIFLEIHSMKLLDNQIEGFETLNVLADISMTISGVTRRVPVKGLVLNHDENNLTLQGNKTLSMLKFNITPPVRFFGMVKVDDELKTAFSIRMRSFKN